MYHGRDGALCATRRFDFHRRNLSTSNINSPSVLLHFFSFTLWNAYLNDYEQRDAKIIHSEKTRTKSTATFATPLPRFLIYVRTWSVIAHAADSSVVTITRLREKYSQKNRQENISAQQNTFQDEQFSTWKHFRHVAPVSEILWEQKNLVVQVPKYNPYHRELMVILRHKYANYVHREGQLTVRECDDGWSDPCLSWYFRKICFDLACLSTIPVYVHSYC